MRLLSLIVMVVEVQFIMLSLGVEYVIHLSIYPVRLLYV